MKYRRDPQIRILHRIFENHIRTSQKRVSSETKLISVAGNHPLSTYLSKVQHSMLPAAGTKDCLSNTKQYVFPLKVCHLYAYCSFFAHLVSYRLSFWCSLRLLDSEWCSAPRLLILDCLDINADNSTALLKGSFVRKHIPLHVMECWSCWPSLAVLTEIPLWFDICALPS